MYNCISVNLKDFLLLFSTYFIEYFVYYLLTFQCKDRIISYSTSF